jgi:hypothetical protein
MNRRKFHLIHSYQKYQLNLKNLALHLFQKYQMNLQYQQYQMNQMFHLHR